MGEAFYKSANRDFTLLHGDCTELLRQFDFRFDMIFADPPYFLSNGGISVQSGKVVCVDKGEWDKGGEPERMDAFIREWLTLCRDKLSDSGTTGIAVSMLGRRFLGMDKDADYLETACGYGLPF